jgi:hypothetical protein
MRERNSPIKPQGSGPQHQMLDRGRNRIDCEHPEGFTLGRLVRWQASSLPFFLQWLRGHEALRIKRQFPRKNKLHGAGELLRPRSCLQCANDVHSHMVIVETAIFTRRIQALISDEQYRLLQLQLVAQPDVGKVIPQSGGLRKVRWSLSRQGKRGGIRAIYYWSASRETILMLVVYAKNEQDDLTRQQLKTLRKIVEEEYR